MKTKAYTDLEQSKRLAEFLPIESADGYWFKGFPAQPYMVYTAGTSNPGEHIPCWSLVALLNVLPKPTKRIYELNIYGEDEKPFFGFNDSDIHKGFEGDDYVDACVNMIIYMHERLNAF